MKVVKELPISLLTSLRLSLIPLNKLKNKQKGTVPAIVSLTSIPSRISTLYLVVRSLLNQDQSPKKILLWLNDSLKDNIPKKLSKLESDLFEIRYSALNCSHRKLIHTLEAYPNDVIITCDDDLLYRRNWLSKIFKEHQKRPNEVIGNHTVYVNHNELKEPLPFKKWKKKTDTIANPYAWVPIGAWGILYPPNALSKETIDKELFLELAPKADDLWFKAMALLKNTKSVQASDVPKEPIPVVGTQKIALKKDNLGKDKNTIQWNALNKAFKLNEIILQNDQGN